jgi:hypothetical protein
MRRRGKVIKDQPLNSGKLALEKGDRVWVQSSPQFELVLIYDNDGSSSKTQGLLFTYGTKEKARKHVVLLKDKT